MLNTYTFNTCPCHPALWNTIIICFRLIKKWTCSYCLTNNSRILDYYNEVPLLPSEWRKARLRPRPRGIPGLPASLSWGLWARIPPSKIPSLLLLLHFRIMISPKDHLQLRYMIVLCAYFLLQDLPRECLFHLVVWYLPVLHVLETQLRISGLLPRLILLLGFQSPTWNTPLGFPLW